MAGTLNDLTPEQFQKLITDSFSAALKSQSGGASGIGGSADKALGSLSKSVADAHKSMTDFNSRIGDFGKWQKSQSALAQMFGKQTRDSTRFMASLDRAIKENEDALDTHGKALNDAERATISSNLKTLRSQKFQQEATTATAETIRAGAGHIGEGLKAVFQASVNYQTNMLGIMAEGGSGFQMAAAAMTASVEKMNAMNQMMASIAMSAGTALGQMGGKFAPMAGLALNVLGQTTAAVSAAQTQLAQKGIAIFAAEGDKLIKTYKEMTGTGVIFGNGMQGLIDATHGTKLRLEEMAAVVKENHDSFARMGMGMSEATTFIGGVSKLLASTTGRFAKADRELLALGFSYQEQAALAADTAAMMSRGGNKANEAQVAQATIEMAKNMQLVAEVAGEDMKAKKKAMEEEAKQLAIKGMLAKMQRDDPERALAFQKQLAGMTDQQRKAAYEMQLYGRVRDKDLAVQMAQNEGFRNIVYENSNALKNGTASGEQALKTREKYAKQELDGYIKSSETIGKANHALGSLKGVADNMSSSMDGATKMANANTAKGVENQKKLTEAAKGPTKKGDPTAALLDAIEVGAVMAKKMQEDVVKRIGEIAPMLKKYYEDMMKAMNTKLPTGISDWTEKLGLAILAIMGLVNAISLFKSGLAGFQKVKGWFGKGSTPEGMPGSGKAGDLLDKNGKPLRGAAKAAREAKLAKEGVSTATSVASKGAGIASKAGGIAKGGAVALGGVALDFAGDALIESGHETIGKSAKVAAKAAEYAGMGAMIGTVIPGLGNAAGAVIGGVIGTGVGLWENFGNEISAMGKDIYAGMGTMWDGLKGKTVEWAGKAGEMFSNAGKFTMESLSKAGSTVVTAAGDAVKYAESAGSKALEFVKSASGTAIDAASKVFDFGKKMFDGASAAFENVKGVLGGLLDSMKDKLSSAGSWLKEKFSSSTPAPAPAAAASPASTTNAASTANTTTKAAVPAASATPQKQGLTAAEKAAVMETVAQNTKYTNDLLVAQQKAFENLQRRMLEQLAIIASHTADGAAAAKKTAANTK